MGEIDTKVIRDKYSFSWADISIEDVAERIPCVKDILILCDSYDAQQKEITRLREALQLLFDTQNGCPLPKYEDDWNRSMELSRKALAGGL